MFSFHYNFSSARNNFIADGDLNKLSFWICIREFLIKIRKLMGNFIFQ